MNVNKVFKRQLDIVKPSDLEVPILIIGAGGIGSWTTLALAKMGCSNITVVDHDAVEIHNIPSQFYKESQVNSPKVLALYDNIEEFTEVNIHSHFLKFEEFWPHKIEKEIQDYKIIISAVDSLETRKSIWSLLKNDTSWELYLDARMGGELLRLLVVAANFPITIEKYEKVLNTKAKASEEVCTAKAIVYNTFLCGGLIAHIVKKFVKKEQVKLSLIFDIDQQTIL
mgnify:CR=1 FL=1